MTQFETDQDDLAQEEESPKGLRQQLAKQAAENQRLQAELDRQSRDLAFTKVGLPSTPMATFFQENYKGDNSEEAIRTRAAELGLIGSPSQETDDQVAAIDQMSTDVAGGVLPLPADREEEMYAKMRQIRPGNNYSQEVERILQEYGRPTMRDET